MSVDTNNSSEAGSALRYAIKQSSRLGDCGPVAVKTVYTFFGVTPSLTYKDFIRTGFYSLADGSYGVTGHHVDRKFLESENLGLRLNVFKIKDKKDFMIKIKSARRNGRPVIMVTPTHFYTIIPHDIVTVPPLKRYHRETGIPYFSNKAFRFYVNKNSDPINVNVAHMRKGSKDLVVCFNSRFESYDYYLENRGIRFVEIENVWREFEKAGVMELYEVKGIKLDFEGLKNPMYEWGSTKSEYKKRVNARNQKAKYWYRKYSRKINRCLELASNGESEESSKYYSWLAEWMSRLEKDCFAIYGIGAELRKEFNKNLPALYEKKEIVPYVKH